MSRPELVFTGFGESMPPPPTPAEIQPLFPQLEIVRLIGRGGMGAVYEAKQLGLQRTVALKLLWTAPNPDAGFEERFAREGRALAQLAHDNVVAVHDAGKAGPYFWLLMEYIDGQNLRQLLQSGLIDPARALAIVMQMCAALEYAHHHGVVHRDIKPENVLITRSGCVKIADFGLAKVMARDRRDHNLTGSYQAMGTPHYMAPEQIERPKFVDHRADIYSLGVVLYEVLTGELPLGRFAMPSRKVRVDARLDDIVAKALQKEPDHRYQAASEVSTAVGIVATPRPSVRPPARRQVARSKNSWLPLALIAASVLVTGVAVVKFDLLSLFAGNKEPTPEEAFARGSSLLTTSESFLEGIALLESAYARNPELPELKPRLAAALPRAVANLLSSGKPYEAVAMVRRLDAIDPSPGVDALVHSTEAQGRAALAKSLLIVSPTPGKTVTTRQIQVVGKVSPDLASSNIWVKGTPVLILDSRFEHSFEFGSDGIQTLDIKVTQPSGLELTLPCEYLVDTQKPAVEVSYPQPKAVVPATFDVLGTVVDGSPVVISVDDEQLPEQSSGDWIFRATMSGGPQTLLVKALDARGLSTEISIPVVVDVKPPTIDDQGRGFELVSAHDQAILTCRVSDDTGIQVVRWDGKKAAVDAAGMVKINADLPAEDAVTVPKILEAVDLAGNSRTVSVNMRRDRKPPVIDYQRQEEAVFAGENYTLVVACDDDSRCTLIHDGKEQNSPRGEDFSISIPIPSARKAGDTVPVNFVVQDAASLRTDGRKVLVVAPRCIDCGGGKACKQCEGSGNTLGDCRKCQGGTNKATCGECDGDGKSACPTCEGSGRGQQVDCWRCDRGRLVCDGCNGSGIHVGPCPMMYCVNGIRRDFGPYTNKPCPTCGGDDRYESKCSKCSGKKSVVCDESGCTNGMNTQPCGACKSGRVPTPCSLCNGNKTLTTRCEDCNEDGNKAVRCKKCSGSTTCQTCKGSGRADVVGTSDPATEIKSTSNRSEQIKEQSDQAPPALKADSEVLSRFPIGSRWSGVHHQDGRAMPSTAVVVQCSGNTVTLEVHNGGQATRRYDIVCAGEALSMVKNSAHGAKADGSPPYRYEPVSVVGSIRADKLSMEGTVKVWNPDGVRVSDAKLKIELSRSLPKLALPVENSAVDRTPQAPVSKPSQTLNTELMSNGTCEEGPGSEGIPNWEIVTGDWIALETVGGLIDDRSGSFFFRPVGKQPVEEIRQDIDISRVWKEARGGNVVVTVEARIAGHYQRGAGDESQVVVEFIDGSGQSMGDVLNVGPTHSGTWLDISLNGDVPKTTRKVRVRLIAHRHRGTLNDGYFDNVSLTLSSSQR